jgi:TROVE domain
MTRLNTRGVLRPAAVMKTEKIPSGRTRQGAPGYAREKKTELFLRATTVFAGEGHYYEDAKTADDRVVQLARELACEDWEWTARFLLWLRTGGNIRTLAIMLAVEAALAHPQSEFCEGMLTPRQVVAGVLQRADEPAEALSYYKSTYGKTPSGGIARGIADAATRLYTPSGVLRWDKPDRMRFADVIELAHPVAGSQEQGILFRYLLDERHHPGTAEVLPGAIGARRRLSLLAPQMRHARAAIALDDPDSAESRDIRDAACGQWEWVMSWLGEGASTPGSLTQRQRWELIIPSMGYMALLRNLRNFEQAGVRDVQQICDRISDPAQVARSRQFPFRFLSAHLNTGGAQWLPALEAALTLSTANIPVLDGFTHILADCSGSMQSPLSRSQGNSVSPSREQAALLFALALAIRNAGHSELYLFANNSCGPIGFRPGASVLRAIGEAANIGCQLGGGTEMEKNIRLTFDPSKHTRSVIITDEQAHWGGGADVTRSIPEKIPVYMFNLAGYGHGATAYGTNRVGLGGLTDASFGIMQRYEAARAGLWPWQS